MSHTNSTHIGIACGGTGGHFFPALAIAREFRRQGGRVTFFLAGQRLDEHIADAQASDFATMPLGAVRMPGSKVLLPVFAARLAVATVAARGKVRRSGVNAFLGMGSFASVPACLAAATLRIPLFLHDGNSLVGCANRFLSRWAEGLAYSLPLIPGQRLRCPHTYTGLPLRESILDAVASPVDRSVICARRKLGPARKTLLVFGGSQGAQPINNAMCAAAGLLGESVSEFQLVHLTGQPDNSTFEAAYAAAGLRSSVLQFDGRIHELYTVADLVLCRSGASTLTELALFRKPAILVPLPTAAEDHQTANARQFVEHCGGVWRRQAEVTPKWLAQRLVSWATDSGGDEFATGKTGFTPDPAAADAVVRMLSGKV